MVENRYTHMHTYYIYDFGDKNFFANFSIYYIFIQQINMVTL